MPKMEITTKYSPENFETKWYAYWMEHGFFSSTPDKRVPYTIVIPPPNVTGVLHMMYSFVVHASRGSMLVGYLVPTMPLSLPKPKL